MGSDQSSHARERPDPSLVLQSPTTAALREGAMSPGRQDSVCSDTDVPYVSYTVKKPIGESPKKVANKSKGRFSSPRLSRRLNKDKLVQSSHTTLVTVNKGLVVGDGRADIDLVRLAQIPSFVPIMQNNAGADQSDIMTRLDHAPLCSMLQKYEDHLRVCATLVTAGQGSMNRMVRETDTTLAEITTKMVDRQKKYEKHAEKHIFID